MQKINYQPCITCNEIWLPQSLDANHQCPPCRGICISCEGPYEQRLLHRCEVKGEKIVSRIQIRLPYCEECCPKPTYSYGFYEEIEEVG